MINYSGLSFIILSLFSVDKSHIYSVLCVYACCHCSPSLHVVLGVYDSLIRSLQGNIPHLLLKVTQKIGICTPFMCDAVCSKSKDSLSDFFKSTLSHSR